MDREVRVYNPNNHTFVQRLDHVENDPVPRFRHKREQTKRLGGEGWHGKDIKIKKWGFPISPTWMGGTPDTAWNGKFMMPW